MPKQVFIVSARIEVMVDNRSKNVRDAMRHVQMTLTSDGFTVVETTFREVQARGDTVSDR